MSRPISTPFVVRLLALLLFLAGLGWAAYAWLGLLLGLALCLGVGSKPPGSGVIFDVLAPLLGLLVGLGWSAYLIWGYYIWGSWLGIAFSWRASTARFWLLSAVQHLIALGYVALALEEGSFSEIVRHYSLVVALICLGLSLVSCKRFARWDSLGGEGQELVIP